MVDIRKVTYKTVAILENGTQLDISRASEDMGWEEGEGEISARISADIVNTTYNGKRLSQTIKPGCLLVVLSDWGGGHKEVVRGTVIDWQPKRSGSDDSFSITAYDDLYCFEQSQDNRYIPAGTGTKSALLALFSDWGVPVGEYKGPDIVHAKTPYKNQYLGDIAEDLLTTAKKQGAGTFFLRSTKGKVDVLPLGSNTDVYHFDEDTNLEVTKDKLSTADLVTRVKVVGKEDSEGRTSVEAILDGKTEYGIRQRIYNRHEDDTLAAAKAEAQTVLDENGEPTRDISLEGPDVPVIRKGDKIHVTGAILNGYFIVSSIRHNARDCTMTMSVTPFKEAAAEEKKAEEQATSGDFEKGDKVILNGRLYRDSYGNGPGQTRSNYPCTITIKVDTSRPCPYHVDGIGWVYPSSLTKA